jgi:hypothetical protein
MCMHDQREEWDQRAASLLAAHLSVVRCGQVRKGVELPEEPSPSPLQSHLYSHGKSPLLRRPRIFSNSLSVVGQSAKDCTFTSARQVAVQEASLGFVQQHDELMPTLTVTETILFGMMFREHIKSSETSEAALTVAALLHDLGLQGVPAALLVCSDDQLQHSCRWPRGSNLVPASVPCGSRQRISVV